MPVLAPKVYIANGEPLNENNLNKGLVRTNQNLDLVNARLDSIIDDDIITLTETWSSDKINRALSEAGILLGAVRTPRPISPLSGSTNISNNVILEADEYRHMYSGITRIKREFQVDLVQGDWSSPFYEGEETDESPDGDSHQVADNFTTNTAYKWRCRDLSADGEYSAWSAEQSFTTAADFVTAPVLTGPTQENEGTTVTIVISNYDDTGSYNITVSGGTFTQDEENISWTLPNVGTTMAHTISVFFTDVDNQSSATTVHTITVVDVPVTADTAIQVTQYEPVQETMSGFTHV